MAGTPKEHIRGTARGEVVVSRNDFPFRDKDPYRMEGAAWRAAVAAWMLFVLLLAAGASMLVVYHSEKQYTDFSCGGDCEPVLCDSGRCMHCRGSGCCPAQHVVTNGVRLLYTETCTERSKALLFSGLLLTVVSGIVVCLGATWLYVKHGGIALRKNLDDRGLEEAAAAADTGMVMSPRIAVSVRSMQSPSPAGVPPPPPSLAEGKASPVDDNEPEPEPEVSSPVRLISKSSKPPPIAVLTPSSVPDRDREIQTPVATPKSPEKTPPATRKRRRAKKVQSRSPPYTERHVSLPAIAATEDPDMPVVVDGAAIELVVMD
eukprot:TRINITY_DN10890_c0_g2_i1.p1 TRINITY_DN10890_c0_g2~~TRINITY_DN10890_c0_g2_i1.p1  ORF type:complete len:341 (+),score=20.21 TRINITY_DN10890_c0_g2_i1:70-1023(+)